MVVILCLCLLDLVLFRFRVWRVGGSDLIVFVFGCYGEFVVLVWGCLVCAVLLVVGIACWYGWRGWWLWWLVVICVSLYAVWWWLPISLVLWFGWFAVRVVAFWLVCEIGGFVISVCVSVCCDCV